MNTIMVAVLMALVVCACCIAVSANRRMRKADSSFMRYYYKSSRDLALFVALVLVAVPVVILTIMGW